MRSKTTKRVHHSKVFLDERGNPDDCVEEQNGLCAQRGESVDVLYDNDDDDDFASLRPPAKNTNNNNNEAFQQLAILTTSSSSSSSLPKKERL